MLYDVVPEVVGLVAINQFSVMGIRVLDIVLVLSRHGCQEVGKALDPLMFEGPVDTTGIVDAKFETFGAYGLR